MATIYVPRSFGSTLILTTGAAPPSAIPPVAVTVMFRAGQTQAEFRDGVVKAQGR